MKFSLRTLVIAAIFGPPLLVQSWHLGVKVFESRTTARQAYSLHQPDIHPVIICPEEEARLGLNTEEP